VSHEHLVDHQYLKIKKAVWRNLITSYSSYWCNIFIIVGAHSWSDKSLVFSTKVISALPVWTWVPCYTITAFCLGSPIITAKKHSIAFSELRLSSNVTVLWAWLLSCESERKQYNFYKTSFQIMLCCLFCVGVFLTVRRGVGNFETDINLVYTYVCLRYFRLSVDQPFNCWVEKKEWLNILTL